MSMRSPARLLRALRDEKGAAIVEFALVVPFLILIMCATIDFGLAVYTLNNLTQAVREGGRYAATMDTPPGADDPQINQRVLAYMSNLNNTGMSTATVKLKIHNSAYDPATGNIAVWVDGYPYKPLTPVASLLGLSTINLNRRAVFRYERAS